MLGINDPYNQATDYVELQLGEAYKTVLEVKNNLDTIKLIGEQFAPLIYNKRPSLEFSQVSGNPAENAARLQAKINELAYLGGGELTLVEDIILVDRPFLPASNVDIIGPGRGKCLIKNVYEGYDYRQSSIIYPGNFHGAHTEAFYNLGVCSDIAAWTSGSDGVGLVAAPGLNDWLPGDVVVVLTTGWHHNSAGEFKFPAYQTIRVVKAVRGSVVYFTEELHDAGPAGGLLHNLRTTTLTAESILASGADPVKLFALVNSTIAGFSVETIGNWSSPSSSTYNVLFSDLDIDSRRILYFNSACSTRCENVRGRFTLKACEFSQNSDDVLVENCEFMFSALNVQLSLDAGYDISGVIRGGISAQENAILVTVRNSTLNMTGSSSGQVFGVNNAKQITYENISAWDTSAAGSNRDVVGIGNYVTTANRSEAIGATLKGIKWRGDCGRYVVVLNEKTDKLFLEGDFEGKVSSGVAVQFGKSFEAKVRPADDIPAMNPQGENIISSKSKFEHGRLSFARGGTYNPVQIGGINVGSVTYPDSANAVVQGAYFGGKCLFSVPILTGGDYDTPPAVSFTDGGPDASGMVATAYLTGRVLTEIRINDAGKNITVPPTVTLTGGGGAGGGTARSIVTCVGGLASTLEYDTMIKNTVSNLRTSKTAARRVATKSLQAALAAITGTTAEQSIVAANIGVGALSRGDAEKWSLRVNVTNANAARDIYLRVKNETDGTQTTLTQITIPAGSPNGTYDFEGTLHVTDTSLITAGVVNMNLPAGATTPTIVKAGFSVASGGSTDLHNKQVSFSMAFKNGHNSDSSTIAQASLLLVNPVVQ